MAISLDSDALRELNSPEAQQLHDLTKELSRIGVDSIVDLPQIVVFGSQNAGKSSVLEAISHIRFPTDVGLCTRFATELELKTAEETRISASVKFEDGRESKSLSYDGFQESDLTEFIQKAKEEMGFSGSNKSFTKDTLRLSIEGPSMYPLQLVDLPGVFAASSAEQSNEDIKTVDDLVDYYLRKKNSIIMLVIAAEYDYHNQATLTRVKQFDESGKRTIGVITKPDVAKADRIRRPYIQLASNQQSDFKLELGWHVMRNRDTENEPHDFAARDAAEAKFFEESSWAVIPRTDRGVSALRARLSKIQFDHLRRSIPAITQEMKSKLAEREEELDRLGTARTEVGDIRNFLYKKAGAFQQLAKEAVEGRYHEAPFSAVPPITQLRNFSVVFDHTLRTKGAERKVVEGWELTAEPSLPKYLEEFLVANPYPFTGPERCTFENLSDELNKEAAKTRGLEFPGSTNDNLALRLFQRQSQKWEEIAQHHIEMVTKSARLFVERAMEFLIGPADTDSTADAILRTVVDSFFEEHEQLLKDKLEEFILPYRDGYALPVDREFITLNGTKSAARQSRQLGDLLPTYTINKDRGSSNLGDQRDVTMSEANLQKLLSERSGRNNQGEFAPGDVLDAMETYYELSRRTFTDNIINLAVESCLIRRIQHIFTPTSVSEMNDDRVKELAKESDHVVTRREALKKETAKLKEALKYCNRYKPRTPIREQNTAALYAAAQKNKEPSAAQKTPTVSTPGMSDASANIHALFQNLKPPGQKDTPAPAVFVFGTQPSSAAKGAANGQSPSPSLFSGLSAAPADKNAAPSSSASPSVISSAGSSGTTSSPKTGGLFDDAGIGRPQD
ncbi:hypothetical protein LLEC1_05146 [Akanthomyces lecanii]|uniref:GED domain-containing protein n=1 Tax=Cordyceps confragosa TaxID=2714763 RepID=A0A179IHL5_CORDF|nr:hypothetical protein LLEC1_05146 [Akanthomyces lecanii]